MMKNDLLAFIYYTSFKMIFRLQMMQVGSDILHFSLPLWTVMNESFFFFYVLYRSTVFLFEIAIFLLILAIDSE